MEAQFLRVVLSPSTSGTHQHGLSPMTHWWPCEWALPKWKLRWLAKRARGKCNPACQAWELRYAHVVAAKLEARIVDEEASHTGCRG